MGGFRGAIEAKMKIAILAASFMLAGTVWADPPAGYPFLEYDDGLEGAVREHKPVFLYFGRYGCGWCEKTNKESLSDPGGEGCLSRTLHWFTWMRRAGGVCACPVANE